MTKGEIYSFGFLSGIVFTIFAAWLIFFVILEDPSANTVPEHTHTSHR